MCAGKAKGPYRKAQHTEAFNSARTPQHRRVQRAYKLVRIKRVLAKMRRGMMGSGPAIGLGCWNNGLARSLGFINEISFAVIGHLSIAGREHLTFDFEFSCSVSFLSRLSLSELFQAASEHIDEAFELHFLHGRYDVRSCHRFPFVLHSKIVGARCSVDWWFCTLLSNALTETKTYHKRHHDNVAPIRRTGASACARERNQTSFFAPPQLIGSSLRYTAMM